MLRQEVLQAIILDNGPCRPSLSYGYSNVQIYTGLIQNLGLHLAQFVNDSVISLATYVAQCIIVIRLLRNPNG